MEFFPRLTLMSIAEMPCAGFENDRKGVTLAGRLDLDHVGSKVGEHHSGEGSREGHCQLEPT